MKQRNIRIETQRLLWQVKNMLLGLKRTKKTTLQLRHKQAEKSKHGPRNQKETKSTRETEKYQAETIRKMSSGGENIKNHDFKKRAESDINEKLNCLWPTNQPKASKAARCDRKVTEISNYGKKKPTAELSRREEKKARVGITGNRKRENDEKKRGGKMWSEVFFFFFFRMTTNSTFFFFAASLMSTFRRWQVLPYQCLPLMGSSHSVGT